MRILLLACALVACNASPEWLDGCRNIGGQCGDAYLCRTANASTARGVCTNTCRTQSDCGAGPYAACVRSPGTEIALCLRRCATSAECVGGLVCWPMLDAVEGRFINVCQP